MKMLVVLTFDIDEPRQAADIIAAIDPPGLPHFAEEVRLTVDPWASHLEQWLDAEEPS